MYGETLQMSKHRQNTTKKLSPRHKHHECSAPVVTRKAENPLDELDLEETKLLTWLIAKASPDQNRGEGTESQKPLQRRETRIRPEEEEVSLSRNDRLQE